MLAVGFVPLYFEVWKRRGRVAGVSKLRLTLIASRLEDINGTDWVFLSIDSLGALFSLFALGKLHKHIDRTRETLTRRIAAQGTFDILGGILYLVV